MSAAIILVPEFLRGPYVRKEVQTMLNKYETVAIYSLKNGEEAAKELAEKFKAAMEANGTVGKVDEWGARTLAYLINDEKEGYYVIYEHECEPEYPAELDRVFRITDGVLRSQTVRL